MDTSRFGTSDILKIAGSAIFVIFGLFNWVGNEGISANAFEWPVAGTIPWILLLGVGIVSVLLALGVIKPESGPWSRILLVAAVVAALLNLILVAAGPKLEIAGTDTTVDLDRSAFLFIAFLGALIAVAGAVMAMREGTAGTSSYTSTSATPPPPPPSY